MLFSCADFGRPSPLEKQKRRGFLKSAPPFCSGYSFFCSSIPLLLSGLTLTSEAFPLCIGSARMVLGLFSWAVRSEAGSFRPSGRVQ
jgi:hypothetical protein